MLLLLSMPCLAIRRFVLTFFEFGCIINNRTDSFGCGEEAIGIRFYENFVQGVFCFHKSSMGHDRFSPHLHPNTEILIKHGNSRLTFCSMQEPREIDGPCILIHPPYTLHRIYAEPDQTYDRHVVYFGEKIMEMFDPSLFPLNTFSSCSTTVIRCADQELEELLPLLGALESEATAAAEKSLILALLVVRISRKARPENTIVTAAEHSYLPAVVQYIVEHADQKISLPDLASRFFVNRDKLNVDFRKYLNITVHQFVMETRIARAKCFLLESKSVKETAELCGFDNVSYFMTAFKNMVGIPPAQYAKAPQLVD